ncbi:dihydroflavonol 4-reductase [Actinidia rufa]|uniref:Dihydroflavonol 4-reductase n=1 Tax=Actinidia rufa TaxID=165716 RepID=A0A7J0GHP8_9ERIC|nr:dihydroflavonol 4-reductase [Actinidia rufa]
MAGEEGGTTVGALMMPFMAVLVSSMWPPPCHSILSRNQRMSLFKPTVDGVLNVMRSCCKAKTVKRIIYTSTTGTIGIQQQPPTHYDESVWTDVDFCRTTKMFAWMYFVAKTEAEKAAWKFAEENGLDLVTIQPSSVIGPFITPNRPPCTENALALITKNRAFYTMLAQSHAVNVDDVCNAHIYLFEHPQAAGRYICSSHSFTIYDVANSLSKKYPEYDIQTKFEGIDESLKPIPCPSKKLLDLGFRFKFNPEEYDVGDLFAEAIEACREKRG